MALQILNIDLESAVINEEKWVVQENVPDEKAREANNSLVQSKAVSHLSRMSLLELNKRQDDFESKSPK